MPKGVLQRVGEITRADGSKEPLFGYIDSATITLENFVLEAGDSVTWVERYSTSEWIIKG